jgi:transposase-like protein
MSSTRGVSYLMIDGYLLPWGKILLVYYAYDIKKVVWFSIAEQEGKLAIVADLKILRYSFWYKITAFINDGWPSILSAIREVYPEAIIQRCLVHVQRQVFNYISRHPKSEAGKALVQIMRYATLSDPELFITVFEDWKKRHFHFLIEKSVSRKGWLIFTHTSLRKAMRHIENALQICISLIFMLTPRLSVLRINLRDTSEYLQMRVSMNISDFHLEDSTLLWLFGSISGTKSSTLFFLFTRKSWWKEII